MRGAQGGCEGGVEADARLLGRINHPNVLRPFAVARCSRRGELALVMPKADRGDLASLLRCAPCSCACSGSLRAGQRPRRPRPAAQVRAPCLLCLFWLPARSSATAATS